MREIIESFIEFHSRAEKLKVTTRHSWLTDSSRQESVAEHSWMLSLLAILLHDKLKKKVDLLKTLKMVIVHDLAESVTGDIPSWEKSDRQNNKYESEKKAFEKIVSGLEESKAKEIVSLWEEFEKRNTPESEFANALDKIEAVMQHNLSDIGQWEQGDFDGHPYYKNDLFDFDDFMRVFKDMVDIQSMHKIINSGNEKRIKTEYLDRYKNGK